MRVQRIAAGVAAAVMVVGGVSFAVAPTASAATVNVTISCGESDLINSFGQIVASPGDTIVLDGDSNCVYNFTDETGLFYTVPAGGPGGSPPYVWVVNANTALGTYGNASDDSILGVDNNNSATCSGSIESFCGMYFYLTVAAPPSVSDQAPPPPPWHQSYGRASQSAPCLEGWNPSYAAWPNDGKGGWVCDRTLKYNASTKTWDVI